MSRHPSQQIAPEHTALYSQALLRSLCLAPPMLGALPESTPLELHATSFDCAQHAPPAFNFSQKLGHLYEDAFSFLLHTHSQYEVLHQNLQLITAQKNTLGELDFVLWDPERKKHIHLEVAVKFYLIYATNQGFLYPGPDARDNYQKKLERMRTHQLVLTRRPELDSKIHSLTQGEPIEVRHCVQGIFFDHIRAKKQPLPAFSNPLCTRRQWLHCHELPPEPATYRVVPKPLWLNAIDTVLFHTLVEVTRGELLSLAQQRCTLFLAHPEEQPRFLAPDTWPDR